MNYTRKLRNIPGLFLFDKKEIVAFIARLTRLLKSVIFACNDFLVQGLSLLNAA